VISVPYQRPPAEFLPALSRKERGRVYTHSILWRVALRKTRCLAILESEIYTSLSDSELMNYLTFNNKKVNNERNGEPGLFFYGKYESECKSHIYEADVSEREIYKTNSAHGAYAYMINPEGAKVLIDNLDNINFNQLDDYFQILSSHDQLNTYCYHPSILKRTKGYTAECMYPIDETDYNEKKREKRRKSEFWPIFLFILIILFAVLFLLVLYYLARIFLSSSNMRTIRLYESESENESE
jgi:GR25 family glycosyltransferase involved in LPS biosynthesis